jgi:hypothetical protein
MPKSEALPTGMRSEDRVSPNTRYIVEDALIDRAVLPDATPAKAAI